MSVNNPLFTDSQSGRLHGSRQYSGALISRPVEGLSVSELLPVKAAWP